MNVHINVLPPFSDRTPWVMTSGPPPRDQHARAVARGEDGTNGAEQVSHAEEANAEEANAEEEVQGKEAGEEAAEEQGFRPY